MKCSFCRLGWLTTFTVFLVVPAMISAKSWALAVDLSYPEVNIATDFNGMDILLFGAKDADSDVVIVVQGPGYTQEVEYKKQFFGIWIKSDSMTFEAVPSYYVRASTRPIEEFIPPALMAQYGMRVADIVSMHDGIHDKAASFILALGRLKERDDMYQFHLGGVTEIDDVLFRTNLTFPSIVHTGVYRVHTYQFKNGVMTSSDTTDLNIQKVGIGADIYRFAHEYALAYGIFAVIIAGFAGWFANLVFKKR